MVRFWGALTLVVTLALAGYAQTFRGAVNGTVMDPSGALVPGASVKITNVATGVSQVTTTTTNGDFAFQDMPLGTYQIDVTAKGFSPTRVANVVVTAGKVYTLPIKMAVGQQATTVEVSAAALAVDTTAVMQSTTIPTTTMQNIPLNGRDFSQLIAVTPGYGGYSVGGFGSLNGTRANQMNWQIDGTDNNDLWHNIPAVNQGGVSGIAGTVLPIDAVDEFSAQTQSNAETGRSAGGTINLAIKSGTNTLHGTAYVYDRNEAYSSASPFLPSGTRKPELRNLNWGGSVGGPIIKDRTFFFGTFEHQNFVIGLSGKTTEVSPAWINQARGLLAAHGIAENPLSVNLFNNLWPSVVNGLPATTNNFFGSSPETGYSNNGLLKLDHSFSPTEKLSARVFLSRGNQVAPTGFSAALGTASSNLQPYFEVAPIRVQNYNLVLNSVFSPRITNQVLFGVSYFTQRFHDFDTSFVPGSAGLNLSPSALIAGKPVTGSPNISISGFEEVGITPQEGRNDITGHLTDALSYTIGGHQLRLGGEVRQAQVDEFYFRHSLGSFSFTGTQGPWSGDLAAGTISVQEAALADFLAGRVDAASITVGNAERQVFVNNVALFAQDAWQVTRRLNLNLGLRYEYMGPLHNGDKNLAVFVPELGGNRIQGQNIDSIFPSDKTNFAPRVGFAYQPKENGSIVIRGGAGIFFDQINMNPFLDFRPPNSAANGLENNPAGPPQDLVSNFSLSGYTNIPWAPGVQIFPKVTSCVTGNVATDPGCGTSIFNMYSVSQHFATPYYYNFNLNVEKSFGSAAVLQVGYVGSLGRRLTVMLDVNQPTLADDANGNTLQQRRPLFTQFPNVGTVNQLNSIGTSNYNSLQSTLRLRQWHGLTAQFAYTWAHALDFVTSYRGGLPQDSFNLKADYASSDFDTRQNFTTYLTYNIPGSSHGPKILTHGWQLSSLMSFHGGQPVNLTASSDTSGTFDSLQRPNLVGDPFAGVVHNFDAAAGGMPWINLDAFAQPAPGTFGNLPRNFIYGPGYADVDFSVIKDVPIKERFHAQLRAEMFNVFNRINLASGSGFTSLSSTCSNAKFACVSDTIGDFNGAPGLGPGEAFNMQLVVKLIF
jgi:hypothetical protein